MLLVVLFIIILIAAVFIITGTTKSKEKTVPNSNNEIITDAAVLNEESKPLDDIDSIINTFVESNVMLINSVKKGFDSFEDLRSKLFLFVKEKYSSLTDKDIETIFDTIKRQIWGYGILQDLIEDDDISDIKIIAEDNVRIKKFGKRLDTNIKFNNIKELEEYIGFIARRNSKDISELHAVQRFTDAKSSNKFILRIDISTSYVNSVDNSYMHIRKIPKNKYLLDDLCDKRMFNDEIKDYLETAARSDLGILPCGKGGSGKTFLLNAFIEEIPHDRAGLIVQESGELFSNSLREFMFQEIIVNKGEGNIEYTLADLVRNGLVSDQDYIGVGEIKGPEAWDLINAAYTGHIPLGSVHTNSSEEAPSKLVHYMRYSPNARDMLEKDLLKTLVGFDVIVFMRDFKVIEITEIEGFDREKGELRFNPVFKYDVKTNKFVRLNKSCKKVQDKIDYRKNMLKMNVI